VGEPLLLEVEASRLVEGGALGSSREDRGPGRESSLHVEREKRRKRTIKTMARAKINVHKEVCPIKAPGAERMQMKG
jgi:hypothetical protein